MILRVLYYDISVVDRILDFQSQAVGSNSRRWMSMQSMGDIHQLPHNTAVWRMIKS